MEIANFIVATILGLLAVVFAFLGWRASRPATQWAIERLGVGQYKITRTGLLPARIKNWEVHHEGPPTGVSHASGEVAPVLFRRGQSIHFSYSGKGASSAPVNGEFLEMRGRELSLLWVHASLSRKPTRGRFTDRGSEHLDILMLD